MPQKNNPDHKTFKRLLRIILVLILSLAVFAILMETRPQPSRQTPENLAPLVETVKVRKTSKNMIIQAYGTVRSGEILNIITEARGKIVEMAPSFEEGNYFPAGSFLMRIDPGNYNLNVERLQSDIQRLNSELARIGQEEINLRTSLKIAQEELRLAQDEYERNLSLAKQNLVSQAQIDQIQQRWLVSRRNAQEIENSLALINPRTDVLKAQLQSAQIQLKEAQLDLERTEIRAPFDGRVLEKLVETGQYVTTGTKLASIYNVGLMEVEVRIPPQDMAWLHFDSGITGNLKSDTFIKARVIFNAPGQKISWDGFVSRIKGEMEKTTRTLPVVIQIEDSHPWTGYPLIPGMFVTVEILGKKVDHLILLPHEAVHENDTVFVAEDGRVAARSVNILRRVGNQVFVNDGLSDGDQVIIRFPGVALEGMKVRVQTVPDQEGASR